MVTRNNGYKIVNMVFKVILDMNVEKIDLEELKEHLPKSGFTNTFPALIWKNNSNIFKGSVSIFNSGKMVITGIQDVNDARKAVEHVISTIIGRGVNGKVDSKVIPVNVNSFDMKMVQMVCNGSFKTNINLNEYILISEGSRYDPEIFPGLIQSIKKDGKKISTMLIFTNGQFVCSGARNENNVQESISEVSRFIEKYGLTV